MKKGLSTFLQLAFGLSILSAILLKLHHDDKLTDLGAAMITCAGNWHYLLPAFLSFAVCIFVCSLRWQVLLHTQDLRLSFHRVHTLYYVGHFFNAFLLGAVGGDVVKAYYVSKETAHKKAEAIATVLIDRLIGLLTLIGLSAVVVCVRHEFLLQSPETRNAVLFTGMLVLAAGALLVGVLAKPWLERISLFQRIMQSTALGRILDRMYTALHACLKKSSVALITIAYSLLNHLMAVFGCYCLGLALELKLSFWDHLTVLPLINLIASIPLTPSGLGTRDAAAIYFYSIFSVDEASAITLSLMLWGIVMFWSLVGGIVYLRYSARAGRVGKTAS